MSERKRMPGQGNTLGKSRRSLRGRESFINNNVLVLQRVINRMTEERVSNLKIDQRKISNLKNGEKWG